MSNYLTVIEVLTIHFDQINRYGGTHGIRDAGALEAAIFRCQSGYYKDTISEAAALWESLSQNHPFLDGNKRVSFACTFTFLRLNGYSLTADADQTYDFIMQLYNSNSFKMDKLEEWLRAHVERIE